MTPPISFSSTPALLLRAALTGGPEGVSAWQTWLAQNDFERDVGPSAYALLPLIYRNLQAQDVDDPLLGRLKGIYRRTWYHNRLLVQLLAQTTTLLRASGLQPAVIRETAVLLQYYQDHGLYPLVNGLALLVPAEQREAAVQALTGAGWKPFPAGGAGRWTPARLDYHQRRRFRSAGGQLLDLHWHALPADAGPHADDDFWAGAVPLPGEAVPALTLQPADLLLQICLYGLELSPAGPWILSALSVLPATAAAFDWERLLRQAQNRRVSLRLLAALTMLSRVWPDSIPAEIIARLQNAPVSPWERREWRALERAGRLSRLWAGYLRRRHLEAETVPELALWAGFPAYVQRLKGFDRPDQLLVWAVSAGARRLWPR